VTVFTRAWDALAAALGVQRVFHSEDWPAGASLRLRIALHTAGAPRRDEGNHPGQAVNRCARLRAVAHDGQVVVSGTTRDLVFDRLPEHAELIDRGVHRLRDLGRPEHVFGLVHPDLPGEFPPLRSLDTMPNNLPGELTSLEDAALLPAAVLGSLGLREVPGRSLLDTLIRHLRSHRALVVLDIVSTCWLPAPSSQTPCCAPARR
jgi:hypothetical protein